MMKVYELKCLNQDGQIESNGFFIEKEDAEIEKSVLDMSNENIRYDIKQQILEHDVFERTIG